MTTERLLLAAMHSIIDTTSEYRMKRVGDYLETHSESFERFAWLPKRMTNNKHVWLTKYVEVRHYADIFGRPPIKNNYYSSYWTKDDHLISVLKDSSFNPDHTTEFTGHPINNMYSHGYLKKMSKE